MRGGSQGDAMTIVSPSPPTSSTSICGTIWRDAGKEERLGFAKDDFLKKHTINKVVGVGNDCAASGNNVAFGERAGLSERGRSPAAQLISIIYSSN